jgi:VCBS repeat-containing protein
MKIKHLLLHCSLTFALILSACGGGSNHHPKVNHEPTATSTSVTTQADTALTGMLTGSDIDGNMLTFTAVAQPMQGTLVVNANGSFTYTPNADTTGTDQFTFKTSDGTLTSAVATVMITINPLDVAFDMYSRQAYAQEGTAQPLPLNTRNVQQNVTDPAAYDDLLQ